MSRLLERGWMLYRMGRHQESLVEFGLARTEPSDRAEAAAGMAFAYLRLGKFRKAAASSEDSIGEQPDFWLGHWALGRTLRLQRKLKPSKRHILEALRLQPQHGPLHAELGAIFLHSNQCKEAERTARTGLKCDPADFACRHVLVSSLIGQKRFKEAADIAFEALAIQPDSASAHELIAQALVHQENYSTAQLHALEALRINPTSEEAREIYVLTLKNSYPIYSAVVRFGMKVGKFFSSPLWIAPLGLFPPCLVGWLATFALFSMVTNAISDVVFAMKKETRRLLTPAEKGAAPWLAIALVFFAIALTTGLSTNSDSVLLAGMSSIAILRPVRTVFKRLQFGACGWYFYLTCLTAVIVVTVLPASRFLSDHSLHPLASVAFMLSVGLALVTLSPRLLKTEKPME